MATTTFFEQEVKDVVEEKTVEVEIGRSSFYKGENLVYLTINGEPHILDEKTGRELCEAVQRLGNYLGYLK